ncbi:hypothetical protein [Helicobacter typhlonius]|uniref:hypothetical protein n=1 Tax=Helicobacter typhlonius TaxID=76936 RepID=UPI002FE2CDB6
MESHLGSTFKVADSIKNLLQLLHINIQKTSNFVPFFLHSIISKPIPQINMLSLRRSYERVSHSKGILCYSPPPFLTLLKTISPCKMPLHTTSS